jgi:hypothetical protein
LDGWCQFHPIALQEFHELRDRLLRQECVLLQTLSFDLTVEHPYDFLLSYVKVLKGDRAIAQYAWNLLNDSMYATALCLQYPPQTVACAMLEFAARMAKRPWPTREGTPVCHVPCLGARAAGAWAVLCCVVLCCARR